MGLNEYVAICRLASQSSSDEKINCIRNLMTCDLDRDVFLMFVAIVVAPDEAVGAMRKTEPKAA